MLTSIYSPNKYTLPKKHLSKTKHAAQNTPNKNLQKQFEFYV